MRILVVHSRYRTEMPSGENRVVDQETAALLEAGHTVERYERHSDDIPQWPLIQRATLPAQVVWGERPRRDLTAVIRRFRPDVIHVHNTFPLISPSVLYAAKRERVPIVTTLHNYKLLCAKGDFFRDDKICHSCADGSPRGALQHGCYRDSTAKTLPVVAAMMTHRAAWRSLVSAYICISDAQRKLLSALELPADRTFIKWNMVPPPTFEPNERRHQVSFVGRLEGAKGIPLLMRSWDELRSRYPATSLRLAVAGNGPLEGELTRWAQGRDDVDVLGLLARNDCKNLVRSSLAVLVPSSWEETFGLVAVEAMAAGTAPVAADLGALGELVTTGVNGVTFAPNDPAALADVLHDIDTDPAKYDALGIAARDSFDDAFRPDTNLDRLLEIYRFAIANPAKPAPAQLPATA
jgi:glycosyltransferase involved in cell wall biosynthesis